MRPDQYKKKRSVDYNKKHNIHKNNEESKNKIEKVTVNSSPTKEVYKKANEVPKINADDVTQNDKQIKTFRRRQVLSNWARYEELPDDSETQGYDFGELLLTAGSASAQLLLDDEQDWTDGDGANTTTHSNALLLDLAHLANAVSCVPLYDRLQIAPEKFPEKDIITMNTEAAANEKVYCHSDYNKTQLKSPDKILMNKSLLNTNHHNNKKSESVVQNESQFSSCNEMTTNLLSLSNRLENILTKEHLSNNLCPALNTNNDSGLTHVSEKSSSGNTSYSTVTSTSYENSSSVNTSFSTVTSTSYKKLAAEDSTTYCSVKTNFQDSFMSQLCELTATTNLNLEDELDNLLNFNSNSTQIYQKETNADNLKGNDELSDWLDSIVDS